MAEFHSNFVKVQAELSDGQTIECETQLKASGDYKEWYEPAPVEYMHGWTESEQDIDEDSIEPLYADEFDTELEIPESVKIERIIKVLEEPDWEVQEGWNEPDEDAAYDEWYERTHCA